MSSTLLYLAIVAVWAIVLVPMWLHRDTDTTTSFSRLLHRRDQTDQFSADSSLVDEEEEQEAAPQPPSRFTRRSAIIARRRRRTAGLLLLTATAPILPALDLTPWYVTAPPVLLLVSHLALLRTATKIDAQRAHEAAEARHRVRQALAAAAKAAAAHQALLDAIPDATLLPFTPRTELFDQYATEDDQATPAPRRAVND